MGKQISVSRLIAFGIILSIAQVGIANAANLTTNADKVESLIEITDIVEKEMQKSTDLTMFDNNGRYWAFLRIHW